MKKRALIFILLLLIAIPMLFLCSCGEEELDDGTLEVILNSNGKKLKVRVAPESSLLNDYEKESLYLFGFAPGESPEDGLEDKTPLGKKRADDEVKFKLPLVDENGISMLYYGFAGAFYNEDDETYVLATSIAYVQNPHEVAENNEDFPTAKSIKGISAEFDADSVALGVSHAVIDIPIERYILAGGSADAESHNFGRNTVFFDSEAVKALDGRMKYYKGKDITVYFRFTLNTSEEELPEGLKHLAYGGTLKGETSYAVNMSDGLTARSVAALADFLAERYTAEESEFGQVSAFIAGNGLNTPGDTAGGIGFDGYLDSARLFVRTLYTAIASHYENGRVYVTVDHLWKTSGGGSADRDGYGFLTEFSKKVKEAGDYPWGVAVETRATSADPDRIWYDNSGSGDYLTPSNLTAVCDDFLDSAKHRFGEEERRLIISGFSVSTTSADDTEKNQAASYAYAYYKAIDAESVDAFIYSSHVDTDVSTSGIRVRTDAGLPGRAREIYSVMKLITTDADIDDKIEDVIPSDSDWKSLYKKYSEEIVTETYLSGRGKVVNGVTDESLDEDYKSSALYSFADGSANGFSIVGNGSYMALTDGGLDITYANPSDAEIGYVYIDGLSKSDFGDDSLLIKLNHVSESCSVTLVLVQRNGDKADVIYESTSGSVQAGDTALVDFDISSFRDEVKKGEIELRLSAVGDAGLPCSLTVEKILTGKEKTNTAIVVILIILASCALVAIAVLFVLWFKKHYKIEFDRSPKEKKSKKSKKVKKKTKKEKKSDAEFHE